MIAARLIPVLLLEADRLVKTVRFAEPLYLGEPINAVRIFNEKQVDELVVLDRLATVRALPPNLSLLEKLAGEAFMPLAYGGGVNSVAQVRAVIRAGFEKVVVGTAAIADMSLVRAAADAVGSQSVVVAIDVRRRLLGRHEVITRSGTLRTGLDATVVACDAVRNGAGEILLTSIDAEGLRSGYDVDLVRRVSASVGVPVVAHGGAGTLNDCAEVLRAGASAAAASSMFVLRGRHRAVLISYPTLHERIAALGGGNS